MTKLFAALLAVVLLACSPDHQSETTQKLQDRYPDSRAFFLYHNTLWALNQAEDPEFDALIHDIKSMKLLLIKKDKMPVDYKALVDDYKQDAFEEVMTTRHDGANFDIFVREKYDKTEGMLVLINDQDELFVLDILGSFDMRYASKLYSTMREDNDLGNKITNFLRKDKDKDQEQEESSEGDAKPEGENADDQD